MISSSCNLTYLTSCISFKSIKAISPSLPQMPNELGGMNFMLVIPLVITRFLGPIRVYLPEDNDQNTLFHAYFCDISVFGTSVEKAVIRTEDNIVEFSNFTRFGNDLFHLCYVLSTAEFSGSIRYKMTLLTQSSTKKRGSVLENFKALTLPSFFLKTLK